MLRTIVLGVVTLLAACSSAPTQQAPAGNPPSLLTLTPEQQLDIYRNIEATYSVRTAKRGTKVHPLPLAQKQIAPVITWQGKTYSEVEAFMVDARISGLLILKNGQIVLERYALGRKPEDRWTSFSVGKSVTSILLGAAIEDGYVKSLDDPVTKYIPQLKGSGYDGVNVRQLVTMTSGVKWNEDYTDPNSDVARASFWPGEPGMNPLVSYMRRLPREAEPGTKFVYKTGETDMAGILIANATGKGLAEYMSEKLWKPYGMERDAIWMVDRGGMERGGCCISMTLRDYGRVGLFMLEGGKAQGRQVVPEWYVRESTTDQVHEPAKGDYGYFWWMQGGGYSARGIFGQQVQVSPSDGLVIAINSAFPKPVDRAVGEGFAAVLEATRTALRSN
ncbi:CubicO group peptidase (beta-lactamase class C family) [Povalibacter uvarum]|uniref:CubicO group peptidase (Beta-lactamase class C family) n=1 Tax=Povalibacter uvarum TaxID=732238 RepID=A0A841HWY3_9GAMM|nr:serine hydrolase [Povalibacter uvarum]MBB6096428.1 CubicO group peptidase (beta-lactamase class C family) [Povalibacter uvarum]